MISKIKLFGVTDGSGDAVITAAVAVFGEIIKVMWTDGDLADGVDAVLTCLGQDDKADETILTLTNANSDAAYYPTSVQHDNAGANQTTRTPMVVDGYLKLVIASGGATKTGGMTVYIRS